MKIRKILAVIICFCAVIALMPRFSFKTEAASIGYKDINGNEWTYSLFGTYRNSDNTYFAGKKRFYIHSGQCNTYGSSYNSDKHPVFSEQFYFGGRTSLKTDNSGKEVITTSITSDKIGDVWTMENQGTRNGNNIYSICMSDGVTYLEDNTGSTALSGADMTVTTNEDDASWWELKYHEQDSTTENKNWYSGRYYFTHDKSGSDPWFYFKNDDGTYILDLSRDDGSYFFLYVELDWFQTVFYDSDGKEYKQDARQIGEFKVPEGPTRTGYTFLGWAETEGSSTVTLKAGESYKPTASKNYYPVYSTNSYTVRFYQDSTLTGTSVDQAFTYDKSQKLTKNTFTRAGYQFENWKDNSSSKTYVDEQTVSNLTAVDKSVITLYGTWNENSYTLNFSLNYGSGSAPSKTYKYSDNVTLPDGKAITRKGFTLVGWNTQLDGKGTGYLPGATVSKITATDKAEITLYAIWQENSYTVNYSANQGSCTVSSKSAKFTESFKLPDKTTVERTGYTFDNWNTKSDGTGTKYSAGTTVSGLSEKAGDVITLYAIWNENSYTVNYFANYSDSVVPSKSYNYSDSFTLPADTEVIRNGYKLIGWNTQPDGLGVGYYSGQEVSQLSSKDDDIINLYAIWEEVHIHSAGEWETVKYPTCVDAGEKVKKCTGCGTIMEKESITALGHIENKCVITNIEASCNGMGEKVWYCERCNAPIKTEAVSATGHKEGKAETKILPTCTSEGVSVIKCETCGIVIREEKIPVLGHTQGYWKTIKESTCTEKGAKQQTCSVCGELINEPVEIEASGHKEGKAETKILPTCTTDGISVIKCETCGIVLREEKIPASGHKEGKAETKILPTCTTDGISVIKCETCGIVVREEKILAYGHKEGAFITEKVPTCTEEGERVSYCEICGASVKTEAIAATGHTPGSKATCVNDQVCEVCGAVLKKSDGESHTFTEWTTCKSARFLSERQDTRKCTSCGKTEYKYVIGSAKCHRYFPHSGNGESCGICLTLYKINNFFRNLFG